ncbi:DUF4212 domain-containing protein [Oceanobacillus iheyensis]|uniref:Hypothetical conserved protein n=1 Tax=Oceanobacillus iheyensis (strain DSM 14371 / CIP 107618 / JCM 11309 / KCTC 3954 / HTE831) TaxID=221109 RepID=Q8EQQ4_OCEIH|nr:DUF4212 domain-containing protein [Oceanobacillus iheyensis]BAC13596.1 hypothetical conserved protein [Oceanobacillus iheyensis HTE831]
MENKQNYQTLDDKQQKYWKKNVKLITILLSVWAIVGFGGGVLLADPLSNVPFFGVSLSFWISQQGAILVFILLILIYAIRMDRLDKEYLDSLKNEKQSQK